MKNIEEINKKRKEIEKVDPESTGYLAIDYLYGKRDGSSLSGTALTKRYKNNKKSISINVRVRKDDAEAFEFIASTFKETRASIIKEIISHDISSMFESLDIAEKTHLSEYVDKKISEGGFEQEYRGLTWMLRVLQPADEAYNPSNQKNWVLMKKNLED